MGWEWGEWGGSGVSGVRGGGEWDERGGKSGVLQSVCVDRENVLIQTIGREYWWLRVLVESIGG